MSKMYGFRTCLRLFYKELAKCNYKIPKTICKRTLYIVNRQSLVPSQLSVLYSEHNVRHKSKKSKRDEELISSESELDDEEPRENSGDKHTKTVSINVQSLRADAILKNALGMARNKVETAFYESKIRLNGEKLMKKNTTVAVGDEIDLLKGPDLKNPNLMYVARIEILGLKPAEESITVKIRRSKSLLVEAS